MFEEPPLPTLDPNPWWGPGERQEDNVAVTQFKINVPEKDLKDLKDRLSLPLRLTPALEGTNFTYGFNSDTLSRIITYWIKNYDWRKRETKLNKYPHYKTQIEGLDMYFLRAAANVGVRKDVKVVPLLLVHGWPGSVVEFYGILPLLTTPREGSNVVFEVICPSIPGYGFSQGSSKPGLGTLQTAQIFLKLMKRLGYDQFYIQGGDWGSFIVTEMAILYPQNILGVHVNMVSMMTTTQRLKIWLGSLLPTGLVFSEGDKPHHHYPLSDFFALLMQETGYLHIQATKPDTIGTALDQSPVALAAYILEKFSTGTNLDNLHKPDGGLLSKDYPISIDSILDNICVYWFTGTITTSVRFYSENVNKNLENRPTNQIGVRVPSGLSMFIKDIALLPESIVKHKYLDIVTYRFHDIGGHFAAMECPDLLAADLHEFSTAVENRD
ncbi:hypothetical protein Pmani_028121 [Petrolisthes manimaculis]|uniref:Epoxide hydrolase n=1 Tax=Petrolisthes manimaculis TaxID=1843537 RepID=A0AAE1P2U4_9EUCA|nr:hypothetical protein Pmani_028121 [Petrolisthes manimaculis]